MFSNSAYYKKNNEEKLVKSCFFFPFKKQFWRCICQASPLCKLLWRFLLFLFSSLLEALLSVPLLQTLFLSKSLREFLHTELYCRLLKFLRSHDWECDFFTQLLSIFQLWIQVELMRWCAQVHCPWLRISHTHTRTHQLHGFFLLPHQLDEEYFWLAEVKSSFLSCLLPMTKETGIDYIDTNVCSTDRFSSCQWS